MAKKEKKENLKHPQGWGENPEPQSMTSEMIPEESGHEKVHHEVHIHNEIESHPKFSKFKKSESHKGE